MRSRAAGVRGEKSLYRLFIIGEERGPIAPGSGDVVLVKIDILCKLFREKQQVFGSAFVHVGEMNTQRLRHSLVLALAELPDHVLNDVFFSHGQD